MPAISQLSNTTPRECKCRPHWSIPARSLPPDSRAEEGKAHLTFPFERELRYGLSFCLSSSSHLLRCPGASTEVLAMQEILRSTSPSRGHLHVKGQKKCRSWWLGCSAAQCHSTLLRAPVRASSWLSFSFPGARLSDGLTGVSHGQISVSEPNQRGLRG